jgi:hypothetical protein
MVILKSYKSWFKPKDLSTPRAKALGSLTECPQDILSFGSRSLGEGDGFRPSSFRTLIYLIKGLRDF